MAIDVPTRETAFQAKLRGTSLTFSTTWGLFSPKGIDAGTHLLLEHLDIQEGISALTSDADTGPSVSRLQNASKQQLSIW